MIYVGIDGDNIGAQLELFLLSDDEKSIYFFSRDVERAIDCMAQSLMDLGMEIIFCSGDSILCRGQSEDHLVKKLPKIIHSEQNGFTFSAGIGHTLKDSYIALKYAKSSGKNRIVLSQNDLYVVIS